MYEWIYAVQHLIDWIDTHAIEKPTRMGILKQVGCSLYYCSEQFRHAAGVTKKRMYRNDAFYGSGGDS